MIPDDIKLPNERWLPFIDYEEYFLISDFGRVYSLRTNKILNFSYTKRGRYPLIVTRFGGRTGNCKAFRVHVMVARCFVDNPDNKPFVNHIDGNKQNAHYSNLEWVTNAENIEHAIKTGLFDNSFESLRVLNKSRRLLTDENVRYIRSIYVDGSSEYGSIALANKFNVCTSTIKKVINHQAYKDVE